jgi:hypothetical protein
LRIERRAPILLAGDTIHPDRERQVGEEEEAMADELCIFPQIR